MRRISLNIILLSSKSYPLVEFELSSLKKKLGLLNYVLKKCFKKNVTKFDCFVVFMLIKRKYYSNAKIEITSLYGSKLYQK